MDTAELIQVIRTTLLRRGDGQTTPIRIITQYWSVDGELLAEVDPLPDESDAWGDMMFQRNGVGEIMAINVDGITFVRA